jgi:hypothetical protein
LVFWNRSERRARLPVRLVGTVLTLVVALILVDAATGLVAPLVGPTALAVLETLGGCTAFVAAVWVAGRWLDHRPLAAFGLRLDSTWWWDLLVGLLLGAGLITAVFGLEWGFGFVRVDAVGSVDGGGSLAQALTVSTLGYLTVAVTEEVLFRGYLLTNLAEAARRLGPRSALVVGTVGSSVPFAAVHAGNPAATPASTAALGVLGVLFAVGYVYTGSLALPIGLHLTWNVFQGPVYGFPVSGWLVTGGSVLETTQYGPAWLTGGSFGPEAGAFGLGAMVVGAGCIVAVARWTGRKRLDTSLATEGATGER